MNSGIPSRSKFNGTVDFPFSVINLVKLSFFFQISLSAIYAIYDVFYHWLQSLQV